MFGKKEIVLHAYTCREEVYNRSKIFKSAKEKPSWWKNLPLISDEQVREHTNMKSCAGMNDLYSAGFTIPLWSDVRMEYSRKGDNAWKYEFADEESVIQVHPESQRGSWASEEHYQHFKIHNPWLMVCDEPIQFLLTNAAYENEKPLDWFVLNGVLNFKYQGVAHINLLAKREDQDAMLFMPFGFPLAQLIPLTERKVTIKHHLVDHSEYESLHRSRVKGVTFQRDYYKRKKCPFLNK